MTDLIGLKTMHYRLAQMWAIILMMVSSLTLCPFVLPAIADAPAPQKYFWDINIMKIVKTGIFALALTSFLAARCVIASPAKGTSAYAAARLKNHPPDSWIKHYLPDDRYKIKGRIWKYVSTAQDKLYYRPESPVMLRKSPDHVIGFPSRAAAEEAGYLPAPDTLGEVINGKFIPGQRVTLSDGVSTIFLPRTWRYVLRKVSTPILGFAMWNDVFQPPHNSHFLYIQIGANPPNANMPNTSVAATRKSYKSGVDTRKRLTALIKAAEQRNGVRDPTKNAKLDAEDRLQEQEFNSTRFLPTTFGGHKGVLIIARLGGMVLDKSSPTGIKFTHDRQGYRSYLTSIGNKDYQLWDYTSKNSGASIMIQSFRPR